MMVSRIRGENNPEINGWEHFKRLTIEEIPRVNGDIKARFSSTLPGIWIFKLHGPSRVYQLATQLILQGTALALWVPCLQWDRWILTQFNITLYQTSRSTGCKFRSGIMPIPQRRFKPWGILVCVTEPEKQKQITPNCHATYCLIAPFFLIPPRLFSPACPDLD